jgi:hypothetical protein
MNKKEYEKMMEVKGYVAMARLSQDEKAKCECLRRAYEILEMLDKAYLMSLV